MDIHEPSGFRFSQEGKEYLLCDGRDGGGFAGWLCYRHPDGQWVTLRQPGHEELSAIWVVADCMMPEVDNAWILQLRKQPNSVQG